MIYNPILIGQLNANLGTKSISANGTYSASDDGYDGYSSAEVNVAANVGAKSVTANGTYSAEDDNLDGYSAVTVNVPANVGTKSITENGTYSAANDSLDGYSSVTVAVPQGVPIEVSTAAGMDAALIAANVGKVYRFTGTTDSNYTNGELYIVEAT